jgi:hypothetical protein
MQRMGLRKLPLESLIESSEQENTEESEQEVEKPVLWDSEDDGSTASDAGPHPERADAKPVKPVEITVPEWHQDLAKLKENPPQSEPPGFDLIQKHQRLEIIESRIEEGIFHNYRLPLQVIEVEEQLPSDLDVCTDEEPMLDEYTNVVDEPKIPNFWPARPWDRADSRLSDAISEQLALQIQTQMGTELMSRAAAVPGRHQKKTKAEQIKIRKKARRAPIIVELSVLDYFTDDYDEHTDFEW